MSVECPECSATIDAEGINAATDIAHCAACNKVHKLSEITNPDAARDDQILSQDAPRGTHIHDDGVDTVIEVSMRSLAFGGFFLAFSSFWNLITSVFVVLAVTRLLGLPPGNSVTEGDTGEPMSANTAWFLLLFMTPFILVGMGTAAAALTGCFGSLRVRIARHLVTISSGVGPLRWNRKFDPAQFESIRETESSWQTNGKHHTQLLLTASPKKIKFGSMLTDTRRVWLAAVLRQRLSYS
ncbi:MAG: hypothetical protein AAF911_05850 [Planctomycetota bacterium]